MPIEIADPDHPSHSENIIYDAHCLSCNDISPENGDELDRPLELVGFEKHATRGQALKEAQDHDTENQNRCLIRVRGIDLGQIRKTFRS